jgi:hypothetical protein
LKKYTKQQMTAHDLKHTSLKRQLSTEEVDGVGVGGIRGLFDWDQSEDLKRVNRIRQAHDRGVKSKGSGQAGAGYSSTDNSKGIIRYIKHERQRKEKLMGQTSSMRYQSSGWVVKQLPRNVHRPISESSRDSFSKNLEPGKPDWQSPKKPNAKSASTGFSQRRMPSPRKMDQTYGPGFFSGRLNKTPLPISLNREKPTGPSNLSSVKLTSDATNSTPKAPQNRLRKFMEEIQESKLNPDKKNFTQTILNKSTVKHQRNYGHTRDRSYHSLEPVTLFVFYKNSRGSMTNSNVR